MKRHENKKEKASFVFFFLFLGIWGIIVICNLFSPTKTFSSTENRVLASFPKFSWEGLVDGSYAKELDSYITDHFVFRDTWVSIKSVWETASLKTESNEIYFGKSGYLFEKPKKIEESSLEKNIAVINQFSQKQNIPVSFLLVPNAEAIYSEFLPDNAITMNQRELIQLVNRKLDSSIQYIEVMDQLLQAKDYYHKTLYFKTDHHMTSLGAYVTYQAYAKQTGKTITPLESFQVSTVSTNFYGTLDAKANSPFTKPDEIEKYEKIEKKSYLKVTYDNEVSNSIFEPSYLKVRDQYSYFLNGNQAKVKIETECRNKKRLLLIKDSYAHIFSQFMIYDFEEIHVIDPRYNKENMSTYIKENNITEVLFLYNVSNFVSDLGLRTLR